MLGISTAFSFLLKNGHIGEAAQNIPRRLQFDSLRTPPPSQLTTDAAARSTGLIPVAFGTNVGWSRATKVMAIPPGRGGSYRRKPNA